jgi:PAS domain S-box-containing protein
MSLKSKISIVLGSLLMLVFFVVKSVVFLELIPSTPETRLTEFLCFVIFIPFIVIFVKEYLKKNKESIKQSLYLKKLNDVLISQSHNNLFYEGDVSNGAKTLVKEVTNSISADRCSIWLYNEDKTSIKCQQLYIKSEDTFYQNIELFKKDFNQYFEHLILDPIIIANDSETHPATKCFKDSYLKPLGIKSMLDVPIVYKGKVIGVICIENLSKREWMKIEVDFSQMLSSLYSFAYSVKESNIVSNSLSDMEEFIDEANIISKADKNGKITYVNRKFTEVSGWTLEEALGKDHSKVNTGTYTKDSEEVPFVAIPPEFWNNMYKTVITDKKIWNEVVTNKKKDGSLYYLDTYVKASFDENGVLKGFTSIRQDLTELKKKEVDITNRMNAINRSNAVIEFDLEGNIIYANHQFLDIMGYSLEDIKGKKHSLFLEEVYKNSKEYKEFWKNLNNGDYFSGEITRVKKDGSIVFLQATYNPIIGTDGKPYRVMKIANDITLSVKQQVEIERKNTYLEHSAKILRHDMHSGINTYMPRGLNSLERRLTEDQIKELKIEAPIKMIKEGLRHTQKVYKGVYEFTNLVKKDVVLNKTECDLKLILEDYLSATAYKNQVIIEDIGKEEVNEALFCTAIDNLIRNGLKYNDSASKFVKIYRVKDSLFIEDNGRGMTQEEFKLLSEPYTRKEGQKESGTGLGLNICVAILEEHKFSITCSKLTDCGTQLKINIKK